MRLLKKIVDVDLRHFFRVHIVIRAHQVEHLGEVDRGFPVGRGSLTRFNQLLENSLT